MKTKHITIDPVALDVLRRSTFKGNTLDLPEQLSPKAYQAVKKAINTAGGKWNKKTHIFPGDARAAFGDALDSGKLVNEKATYQAYFTPPGLAVNAAMMLANRLSDDGSGLAILEPSAGEGALALAIATETQGEALIDCYELEPKRAAKLAGLGFWSMAADFLTITPEARYDGVLMNPPFTRDQDAEHVCHAWQFLKPGGVLVAIVSRGYKFRSTAKAYKLLELVAIYAEHEEEIPAGTFAESGTDVATALLVLRK